MGWRLSSRPSLAWSAFTRRPRPPRVLRSSRGMAGEGVSLPTHLPSSSFLLGAPATLPGGLGAPALLCFLPVPPPATLPSGLGGGLLRFAASRARPRRRTTGARVRLPVPTRPWLGLGPPFGVPRRDGRQRASSCGSVWLGWLAFTTRHSPPTTCEGRCSYLP